MNEIKLNVSQSRGYENANLELIKVTTNEQGQKLVSGRELHEVLKVEKAFSTWIQTQLENVDAIENQDFCTSFKGRAQGFLGEDIDTITQGPLFIIIPPSVGLLYRSISRKRSFINRRGSYGLTALLAKNKFHKRDNVSK